MTDGVCYVIVGKTIQEATIASVYKPEFQITIFVTSRPVECEVGVKSEGRAVRDWLVDNGRVIAIIINPSCFMQPTLKLNY